jgi:1-acyl-sn-glycerol-3-phosphate acyltransferase
MIYRILRWMTGIALHWFYSDIRVISHDRIPLKSPVLLAASHHNALVDCLIVGLLFPRRITITAKATLTENKFVAALFNVLGIVPLRRTGDEQKIAPGETINRSRNAGAFENLLQVLKRGGAVLIFPEGKSHNEPELAPLKTGLARIAIQARGIWSIRDLRIVPLGLNFENKGQPGSRVVVEVGDVLVIDELGDIDVTALTTQIAQRLRAVSLKRFSEYAVYDPPPVKRLIGNRLLISAAARWGEWTHRDIIRIARELAIRKSRNADDPAMLTILFGIALILLSYLLQGVILYLAFGLLWSLLYLASLPIGAYWAAFKDHPERVALPVIG